LRSLKVGLLGVGTAGLRALEEMIQIKEHIELLNGRSIAISGIIIKNDNHILSAQKGVLMSKDFEEIINKQPEVIIEAIDEIELARTYIEYSFKKGCHVVSSNKECIARYGEQLQKTADINKVQFIFEANVVEGISVIRSLQEKNDAPERDVEAILKG
jgi:homoserine dehydrogenase